MDLKKSIRIIPDYPKKGISFKDITPLLKDKDAFAHAIDSFYEHYKDKNVDAIVGIESRGFIFGTALAYKLGVGFVPARKEGKLPSETIREEFALEYGNAVIEIHKDSITQGDNILVIDDLIATGGTALACLKLVEVLGGTVVGLGFLIDLTELKGKEKLEGYDVFSLIHY